MIAVCVTVLSTGLRAQTTEAAFEVLFVNGRVIDGTGNPWTYADVGIRDGKIAAVGVLTEADADRVIDLEGRVLVPGFIDVHSHADGVERFETGLRAEEAERRAAPNLVAQGATTVVVNQDGRSPLDIHEQRHVLEEAGFGPNVALLVGHGSVRAHVLGDDYRRAATEAEILEMKRLVREAMQDGAYGISAGLEYPPGRWSTPDEVVALVEEIVPYGGVYIAHQRSEGPEPMWYWPSRHDAAPSLIDAIRETIEIGERTGATVMASHIKVKGAHYWGKSREVIDLINAARQRGVDVWADQYQYNTSGTDGNTVLIPRWAYGLERTKDSDEEKRDYTARLQETLEQPELVEKLRQDIRHEIRRRGGAENIVVFEYPDSTFIGKTLAEVAQQLELPLVQAAIELQLRGDRHRRGGGRLRGFSMSESDLEAFAAQPWTATSTDAGVALPGDGPVHPRFYGAFPRKIRRYALDRGALAVEDAIRSATSLPAQILGLQNRGLIREGFWADLVVLDLERLHDRATFFEPHQYPEGVDYVLINGAFVVDGGALTGALPGKLLTPGRMGRLGSLD